MLKIKPLHLFRVKNGEEKRPLLLFCHHWPFEREVTLEIEMKSNFGFIWNFFLYHLGRKGQISSRMTQSQSLIPEMSIVGNWAKPGPRMLGWTLGNFMFLRASFSIPVPLFRILVNKAVNCLLDITVPMKLTQLTTLITSVNVSSLMLEMSTLESSSIWVNLCPIFRWSNRDVLWKKNYIGMWSLRNTLKLMLNQSKRYWLTRNTLKLTSFLTADMPF